MQLSDEVRGALQASTINGASLVLPRPMTRELYVKVDKALGLMGGSWNKKAKAHLFEEDANDVVTDAIATGAVVDFRKEFNFFETPPEIARLLVTMAGLQAGHLVLEPSAGSGRIVDAIRAVNIEPMCCELWDKNCKLLEAKKVEILCADFFRLTMDHCSGFDRIIANPPFSRGQDMKHVLHMYELLRPGGVLVSVMCPAWQHNSNNKTKEFRKFLASVDHAWEPLPEGAFKESGTMVRTGILVVSKKD